MKAGTRTLWTFAITSIALFMVVLDNLVVSTALPVIRVDLGASIEELEWTVNAYTLTFAVFAPHRRRARRPLRPQAHVHRSASASSPRRPQRPRSRRRRTGSSPRARSRGSARAIVTPLTLTILSAAVARREARARARRVVGHRRPRRRDRPARRRRGRRGHLVAVDLLAERSRRDRPAPARAACSARRTGRTRRSTSPASRSPARACSASSGACPRERRRLDEPADRRRARRRRAPARGVRRVGAADAAADAADALLPQPRVRGRERRVAVHVLRDVRLDLPAHAVLPDRAGLLAARGRACASCRGRLCRCSSPRSRARSPTASAGGR